MNATPPSTRTPLLRIGQLARRTGISAKALRLYEQRGLLQPCSHSAAGYRLYGPAALRRLMQIVLLRQCGLSLAEIAQLHARDSGQPAGLDSLLATRIAQLEREQALREAQLQRLRTLARHAGQVTTAEGMPSIDQLVEMIAMAQNLELSLTDTQRAALHARAEALGESGLAAGQQAWKDLIAEVQQAMASGMQASAPAAQALAQRWHALVQAFTGGDADVAQKLGQAWRAQPGAMQAQGMSGELFGWVCTAMQHAGLKPGK